MMISAAWTGRFQSIAEERKTVAHAAHIKLQLGEGGQVRNVLKARWSPPERVPFGLSRFRSCRDRGPGLISIQPES